MNDTGEGRSSARRRLLLGVLTSVITLTVLVGATEVVLRLRGFPFKPTWTPSENAMARFDPDVGWSYIPDGSYVRTFGKNEREVPIHFDALGARVAGQGAVRDADVPAVLFVGGSFTMGHGLPYEETFAGVLEADADVPFQAVNLGVQGFGTDQALLQLELRIGQFDPVAVVYTFIDKHILRNASDDRRLMLPRARVLGTKPFFALRRDGSLYLEKTPVLLEDSLHSNLWDWIRLVRYRKGPRPGPELTEALVARMAQVAAAAGAKFIVVVWRQGVPAPDLPAIDWDDALAGAGSAVVDTGDDPPDRWDAWVIPGDGHPDARAHAHVAGLLKRQLQVFGVVEETAPPLDRPSATPAE